MKSSKGEEKVIDQLILDLNHNLNHIYDCRFSDRTQEIKTFYINSKMLNYIQLCKDAGSLKSVCLMFLYQINIFIIL